MMRVNAMMRMIFPLFSGAPQPWASYRGPLFRQIPRFLQVRLELFCRVHDRRVSVAHLELSWPYHFQNGAAPNGFRHVAGKLRDGPSQPSPPRSEKVTRKHHAVIFMHVDNVAGGVSRGQEGPKPSYPGGPAVSVKIERSRDTLG